MLTWRVNRTPSDDVEDGFGVRARGVSSREKIQRTHVRRRVKRYASSSAAAALFLSPPWRRFRGVYSCVSVLGVLSSSHFILQDSRCTTIAYRVKKQRQAKRILVDHGASSCSATIAIRPFAVKIATMAIDSVGAVSKSVRQRTANTCTQRDVV